MRYKAGLETRERILEATRSVLAGRGLEGTTIKAICERAGVLAGSFYNLFDSKEQAILTVVREAIDAVDPDPDHTGTDTVDDLVDAYVRFLDTQADLARVYVAIAVSGGMRDPELRGRVLRHHQGRVRRFADALLRDHPALVENEAVTVAETLVSSLNGIALQGMVDPQFDVGYHSRAIAVRAATAVR